MFKLCYIIKLFTVTIKYIIIIIKTAVFSFNTISNFYVLSFYQGRISINRIKKKEDNADKDS